MAQFCSYVSITKPFQINQIKPFFGILLIIAPNKSFTYCCSNEHYIRVVENHYIINRMLLCATPNLHQNIYIQVLVNRKIIHNPVRAKSFNVFQFHIHSNLSLKPCLLLRFVLTYFSLLEHLRKILSVNFIVSFDLQPQTSYSVLNVHKSSK